MTGEDFLRNDWLTCAERRERVFKGVFGREPDDTLDAWIDDDPVGRRAYAWALASDLHQMRRRKPGAAR
jgi:hypothetical protein